MIAVSVITACFLSGRRFVAKLVLVVLEFIKWIGFVSVPQAFVLAHLRGFDVES